ncbi:MAG: YceH family protein [Acidimicrobiia bacterium]|nr:YceH family protein [Acidimicrobiia bacterium]
MDLDTVQTRVLGALLEKAATTPEHYPLSTPALVTACNQKQNREPVTDFGEPEVLDAIRALRESGLARSVKRPGDRVMKHRHDAGEALKLDEVEQALIAVLLLRGAQTPGELRSRTERYVELASTEDVEAALGGLAAREEPLVRRLERVPGQKESRWCDLLREGDALIPASAPSSPRADRLAALEAEVAALRLEVAELRRLID